MDLCPHEDDPATCPPCVNARRPKPKPPEVYTFAAGFDGDCPSCHLPIHVGQIVGRRDDGGPTKHKGCL